MIENIIAIATASFASDEKRAIHESQWYDHAGAWCACLDEDENLPLGTAAGFVAALSPLNSWESQLHYSPPSIAAGLALIKTGYRAHEGIRGPGFFANKDKAARILSGEAPLSVLGGDKVCAFYKNLTGDFSAVTIDRHAVAIAGYTGKGLSKAGTPTARLYSRISIAYKFAGERFGLSGAEIQAVAWCHWRRLKKE